MYDLYYNKQAPSNITESPLTTQGFSGTPQTNSGITTSQTIGIGFAAARIIPAGKQVFNTVIKATGDKRVQKTVQGVSNSLAFGVEVATLGVGGALAVEGIKFGVNMIQGIIQDDIDQTNQAYEIQKVGVSVNKFVGVGERID